MPPWSARWLSKGVTYSTPRSVLTGDVPDVLVTVDSPLRGISPQHAAFGWVAGLEAHCGQLQALPELAGLDPALPVSHHAALFQHEVVARLANVVAVSPERLESLSHRRRP